MGLKQLAQIDWDYYRSLYSEEGVVMTTPKDKFTIHIGDTVHDAEMYLRSGLKQFAGENYTWLEAYNKIAEYLNDSKGKGLLLYGNVGTGKTIISRCIIPILIRAILGKSCMVYDAEDILKKLDTICKHEGVVVIDDIGTESTIYKDWGTERTPLYRILDCAEKNGATLIFTSNIDVAKCKVDAMNKPILNNAGERDFSENGIVKKYGMRAFDRLRAQCKPILVTGKSMR